MKALIIEDENLIAKELKDQLQEIAPDIQILDILPSVKTAKRWFMEHAEPDIIFADIQLSDGVSFEIFKTYQLKCPIIFTTAYDEYAILAFKVNGFDYLLKPVDTEELQRAVEKCRTYLGQKPYPATVEDLLRTLNSPHRKIYKEKFIVHFKQNWIPIPTAEIACFVRENINYLYTMDGQKYILDFGTLEEIEELVDPQIFYRANRQCIVNIEAIQSVRPFENQKLSIALKKPLELIQDVSRHKAPEFKKWFDR